MSAERRISTLTTEQRAQIKSGFDLLSAGAYEVTHPIPELCKVLGIDLQELQKVDPEGARSIVKKNYRRSIMASHPDTGGNGKNIRNLVIARNTLIDMLRRTT